MGWFLLRHLQRVYREFEGDFLLALILGEIAHHNICRYYSSGKRIACTPDVDFEDPEACTNLESCNAYSLSNATGIPRETVRRKAAMLIKRGWVKRDARGAFVVMPAVSEHFCADFNVCLLEDLLRTADEIRTILGRDDLPAGPARKRGSDHANRSHSEGPHEKT